MDCYLLEQEQCVESQVLEFNRGVLACMSANAARAAATRIQLTALSFAGARVPENLPSDLSESKRNVLSAK
jgi:hypothetical protein